jgi:hypothetical protein
VPTHEKSTLVDGERAKCRLGFKAEPVGDSGGLDAMAREFCWQGDLPEKLEVSRQTINAI